MCRGRLSSNPAAGPVPGTRPLGAAGALDGILAQPVRRGLEAMAAEVDTDALAERVYVSMVGDEAWRRLPEELKAHRRAEGMAFQT